MTPSAPGLRPGAVLREGPAPETPLLTFVQLTDAHMSANGLRETDPGRGPVGEFLAQAVAEINDLKPDFVVFTGDLVENGTPGEYRRLKRIMAALAVPWHAVPGNHETLRGARAAFEEQLGQPRYRSFVRARCQFILLDGSRDERRYHESGHVDDRQMRWFRKALAAGAKQRYTFVCSHWPLLGKWKQFGIAPPGRDTILAALKAHKVAGYLFGHQHEHDHDRVDGTTHILCAGIGWNFSVPRGYRIYRVYPTRTISTWKPLGAGSPCLKVTLPNPRASRFMTATARPC